MISLFVFTSSEGLIDINLLEIEHLENSDWEAEQIFKLVCLLVGCLLNY